MYGGGLGGYMQRGSPGWISSGSMGDWGRVGVPQHMGYAPPPEYGFNAMGPGQYDLQRPMGPDLPPEMGGPPVRDPSRPVTDYLPGSGIEYIRGGVGPVEAFANTRYLQERQNMNPQQRAELDRAFEAQRGAITARQDAIRQLGPRALYDELQFQRGLEFQQARYSQQQRNKIAQIEAAEQLIKDMPGYTPEEKQTMLSRLGMMRSGINPSQIAGPVDQARLRQEQAQQKQSHAEEQMDFKREQAKIANAQKMQQAQAAEQKDFERRYQSAEKALTVTDKFDRVKKPSHEQILSYMKKVQEAQTTFKGEKPAGSAMGNAPRLTPEQQQAAGALEKFRAIKATRPLTLEEQDQIQALLRQYDGQ